MKPRKSTYGGETKFIFHRGVIGVPASLKS